MIVSVLNPLGFSQLFNHDKETYADAMTEINQIIENKYTDNKTHPVDSYQQGGREFVKSNSITTFQYLTRAGDFLAIGAAENNADDFVKQISKFVSAVAMRTLEPFRFGFDDVNNVKNTKHGKGKSIYGGNYYNAFPILFRGGICVGNQIDFMIESHDNGLMPTSIYNGQRTTKNVKVAGQTYTNACRLESSDNGPRLFCSESLSELVSDSVKDKIIDVSAGVSEILWTYYACETDSCSSYKQANVNENMFDGLIVPTINLIKYYNSKDSEEAENYIVLLRTALMGLKIYASENKLDITYIKKKIHSDLPDLSF